jgi:hypothetical protein
VTCFDLDSSSGLNDTAFLPEFRRPIPDIGMVGIVNPLGQGSALDLRDSPLLHDWRAAAVAQIARPEMELNRQADSLRELAEVIAHHEVTHVELTVYALGTVYLRFELGPGIRSSLAPDVLRCFEYAAYRLDISTALHEAAKRHADRIRAERHNRLGHLTRRPQPDPRTDGADYQESNLIAAFTALYRCVDEDDLPQREKILRDTGMSTAVPIEFEYHGTLYYDWAACLLWPRGEPTAPVDEEFARMLECIRIAHTSLGICDALLSLTQGETNAQVLSYASAKQSGRSAEELNQLRTFALAVVNLTRVIRVTQTAEDRKYFDSFAGDAHLDRMQQSIIDTVEVLFNVQNAAAEVAQARRESRLNSVVIVIASLTLVSVSVDAYNFVREDQTLIADVIQRALALGQFVLGLCLLVAVVLLIGARRERRRGGR